MHTTIDTDPAALARRLRADVDYYRQQGWGPDVAVPLTFGEAELLLSLAEGRGGREKAMQRTQRIVRDVIAELEASDEAEVTQANLEGWALHLRAALRGDPGPADAGQDSSETEERRTEARDYGGGDLKSRGPWDPI